MVTLLRALCVLMILSGIGGVVVGDQSAVVGWWLIVVFSALLFLTFVSGMSAAQTPDQPRSRILRFRPVTAVLIVVAAAVIVPVALLMLTGGA